MVFDEILDAIDPHLAFYLVKYRTSNHRLPVETGRWRQIPLHERKCLRCNNELGDEFHYLFVCPQFKEIRTKYLKPYYYRHPSMFKAQQLFQNKNIAIIRNMCLMIKQIMLAFK